MYAIGDFSVFHGRKAVEGHRELAEER